MVFNSSNRAHRNVKVYDAQGKLIVSAYKYNTKTRTVSMFLTGKKTNGISSVLTKSVGPNKWELLRVTVKIPGSYAVFNGKKF